MTPATRQSPWTGTWAALATLAAAAWFVYETPWPAWRHPAAFAAAFWVLLVTLGVLVLGDWNRLRERRRAARRPAYHGTEARLARAALLRFVVLAALFGGLTVFYLEYPLYADAYYRPWRDVVRPLYQAFLLGGLPYIWVTLRWHGGIGADCSDPAVHSLLLLRGLVRAALRRSWRPLRRLSRNRRQHRFLLGLAVEAFFLPLMTVFMASELRDLGAAAHALRGGLTGFAAFREGYALGFHGLILMDVAVAIPGYLLPLRWLDNKIQSVDRTVLGWVAALICYPPFNKLTWVYLPRRHEDAFLLIHDPYLRGTLMVLTLLFLSIYVWATMAFGPRFSNLTHRGILTRGPYAWVRHPAYAAKNLSWWTELLPWCGNPWNFVSLLGWNAIYILRAITEERHLRQFEEYRAYAAKVRYRFIPGVW
jgi:protein-S-isoprenylcysteine O-methyltransferase Ste14